MPAIFMSIHNFTEMHQTKHACINHEFDFDKLNQIKWTIDFPIHLNYQVMIYHEFTFKQHNTL